MILEFLQSKIHRATVTDANLNYVGSITIDETLLKSAKMREWQKVEILDVNNGERFQTYIIKGKAGSGEICLNGAAARKVQKGDKVIIVTYGQFEEKELQYFSDRLDLPGNFKIRVLENGIKEVYVDFGKWKGTNIDKVDKSYCKWMMENNVFPADTRHYAKVIYERK